MTLVLDGPVLPDDLTTYVREVPLPATMVLNQILPDRLIKSDRVDIGQITKRGRTARFRAFDGPIHAAQRDLAQVSTVRLPPLSDSLAVGEYERLQIEFARTGGTNTEAFVDAIYNDAENLTLNALRRMELARGDVLTDGKFTLTGEGGLFLEADYQLPSGNLVTAGTLWSNTGSADVVSDLTSWMTYYINLNGFQPKGMWISRQTLNQLLNNVALRTAAGSLLGAATFLTRNQLNQLLDAHTLPPILGVYDTQVDVDGTSTRVIPANKVIFVPPDDQEFGYTAWGVSATALELVNSSDIDMSFENAPGIVGVICKDGPPFRQYTFVDAVGMPVIENPFLLMVATVA